jgi:hypothetical protein
MHQKHFVLEEHWEGDIPYKVETKANQNFKAGLPNQTQGNQCKPTKQSKAKQNK